MRRGAARLSYANVVATIALFLALGGGAVWAAGKVRSGDLAKNAVRSRNIAPHAVTNRKLRKHTLKRSRFKAGTLAGLHVIDMRVPNVTGVNAPGPADVGTVIGGNLPFVPKAGKSYLLEEELRGHVTDGDGPGGGFCAPHVDIWVNGQFLTSAFLAADADSPPQFNTSVGDSVAALGLTSAGQTQTVTAHLFGDPGCGTGSTIDQLRLVVVQLG